MQETRSHHHYNNSSSTAVAAGALLWPLPPNFGDIGGFLWGVLARLRSGTYQDLGGPRWIVVATHSLVLQFGHKLAFQGVHLVRV
jgi:hypothetical protein